MVKLVIGRECFVGLSILLVYALPPPPSEEEDLQPTEGPGGSSGTDYQGVTSRQQTARDRTKTIFICDKKNKLL